MVQFKNIKSDLYISLYLFFHFLSYLDILWTLKRVGCISNIIHIQNLHLKPYHPETIYRNSF